MCCDQIITHMFRSRRRCYNQQYVCLEQDDFFTYTHDAMYHNINYLYKFITGLHDGKWPVMLTRTWGSRPRTWIPRPRPRPIKDHCQGKGQVLESLGQGQGLGSQSQGQGLISLQITDTKCLATYFNMITCNRQFRCPAIAAKTGCD